MVGTLRFAHPTFRTVDFVGRTKRSVSAKYLPPKDSIPRQEEKSIVLSYTNKEIFLYSDLS
jgi:hypothetical protein